MFFGVSNAVMGWPFNWPMSDRCAKGLTLLYITNIQEALLKYFLTLTTTNFSKITGEFHAFICIILYFAEIRNRVSGAFVCIPFGCLEIQRYSYIIVGQKL